MKNLRIVFFFLKIITQLKIKRAKFVESKTIQHNLKSLRNSNYIILVSLNICSNTCTKSSRIPISVEKDIMKVITVTIKPHERIFFYFYIISSESSFFDIKLSLFSSR